MQPKGEQQDLISLLQAGDAYAFEHIYHLHKQALFHFALRYLKDHALAEDALQEVFIKLWNKRETLDENLSLKGFLFTCMKHHVLNVIRTEQNRIKIAVLSSTDTVQYANFTQQEVAYQESKGLVEAGIQMLSEGKKKIFRLSIIEGYSNQEIAALLNISEHTVRSQLSQSGKLMREYLNKALNLLVAFLYLS
ncbi:RNA polymerase sigma factor [Catalinimonas niigatensis]|uniref:RNA polymerase sigma factor n=1 Tax=Catalinimonas niigatensis TaxID=1397264 RepID=UPI00266687C0|nr:RNA polymerase sigma-70 factor [Catalinimonas niigatensis]WPP49197.1 RNA polymerase sigma-70 factor [Catalinimonas niigatensis]